MVGLGDKVLVLKDQNGDDVIIESAPIGVGDRVILFQDSNGEYYAVKNGPIGVGDKVIIAPTQDGDEVILKPGGCAPVTVSLIRTWIGTHRSYSYRLGEDFTYTSTRDYPKLNLKIDFNKKCEGGSIPPTIPQMYPCGAAWIGLGSPDSYGDPGVGSWLWRLYPNPYATLGFGFDMDIRTGESSAGVAGTMGKLHEVPMAGGVKTRWCIPNMLYYYTGRGTPVGFTARYIHVHIRNTISLFFGGDGGSVSEIGEIRACKGIVCKDDEDSLCRDTEWCYK